MSFSCPFSLSFVTYESRPEWLGLGRLGQHYLGEVYTIGLQDFAAKFDELNQDHLFSA